MVFHLEKLESPSPEDALCQVWLKIDPEVLEKKIFKFVKNVISLFRYYLHWKKVWPFIGKKLSPHHQRMHCAKFGWNWPSDSKVIFFLFRQYIFAILFLSPLGNFLIWGNLNSLHPRMLCKFSWYWSWDSG